MSTLINESLALQPARRTELLGFSDIVKIRNRVLALLQQGVPVIRLEGGEPFSPTPDFIKDAMKRALDENQTRYAPSSGVPALLTAISGKLAEKNHYQASEDQIIITSGGMHGLFCAFQATLNPGDEILLFSPYWTPIKDLITFCEAKPVLIGWRELDRDSIDTVVRRKITSRTRAIYVNTPSNPTGDVLSRAQLEAVARIASEHNLVVVSDEAYEDLVYDAEHVSIASLPDMASRTISVYTLSKTYAMTGWRIGYLAADPLWMPALRKLVLNTVNGVSTPTQFAAAAAIADRSSHLEKMRGEYRTRRDLLVRGVNEAGLRCASPAGAFYLLVDVRERLGNDSWAAMNTLLDRTSIASVPGIVFGPEGEGHLRMSFSVTMEILERALEALRRM
jgi:aspartate aminotransferase